MLVERTVRSQPIDDLDDGPASEVRFRFEDLEALG
jgi:hypothetical protein